MSRSYKKHPWYTDHTRTYTKFAKHQANIKVRRTKGLYNGSSYKKLYDSWDIHDWVSYWPKNKAIHHYEVDGFYYNGEWIYSFDREEFPTSKSFVDKYWKKYHYRK